MEDRIDTYYDIWNSLPENRNACLVKKGILKSIQLTSWINSGLFGDVYGGYIKHNHKSDIKNVTKLKKTTVKNPNYDVLIKTSYPSPIHKKELKLTEMVSNLVFDKKCPHFPLQYDYYQCNDVRFKGQRNDGIFKAPHHWDKVKRDKGLIQILEYSGIPFYKWLTTKKPSSNELHAVIAQVLLSIYCLRKHVKINHEDLYFSNIVMYKIDKPINFQYVVNKKIYNILVERYYPIIIDFGQSESVKKQLGSKDVFTFLTDFCVSKQGDRPNLYKGKIVYSYKIPNRVKSTINSILNDILYYMDDVEFDYLPYKEWIKVQHVEGDYLLKKYFYNMFKNKPSKIKSIEFKI